MTEPMTPTREPRGFTVVVCDVCGGAGTLPTVNWDGQMWCWKCPDGDGWWYAPVRDSVSAAHDHDCKEIADAAHRTGGA